ncbi:MAG: hypothetical protein CMB78_03680 [Euryarchaeota archaeon]|nr:hypothetical protein [Euryarchaeota archaeon]|tara:strand:+ start:760 stop:1116 length:357 start_codon:yes stop_codon:yes gene_type:complete
MSSDGEDRTERWYSRKEEILLFLIGFIVFPFVLFLITTEVDGNAQELEYDVHEDSIAIWPIFLCGVFIYGFKSKRKSISYGVVSFLLFAFLTYILGLWGFRWSWLGPPFPTSIVSPYF